jgi:hypothetical protein
MRKSRKIIIGTIRGKNVMCWWGRRMNAFN